MKREKISEAMGNISSRHIKEAAEFKAEEISHQGKPIWIKWIAIAACFCLMITATIIIAPHINHTQGDVNNAGDGVIAMLFTEAKVIEVYSATSVLVEITNENIYGANTDKNLFAVGEIIRADFNEEIVLNFKPGDIVIIGRGNTAKVDYSQKPYIAQCNSIKLKVTDNNND